MWRRSGRVRDPSSCCFGSLTKLFFSVFGFEDFYSVGEDEAALDVGLKFLEAMMVGEEVKKERREERGR